MNSNEIKKLIHDIFIKDNLKMKIIPEEEVDFAIHFEYPPNLGEADPNKSKTLALFKPKDKNFLIMSISVQISEDHRHLLQSIGNNAQIQYLLDLRKYLLLKDVYYEINSVDMRYEISDKIFFNTNSSAVESSLHTSMHKIYNCYIYSNVLLTEILLKTLDQKDFEKDKDFTSGLDYTLYI